MSSDDGGDGMVIGSRRRGRAAPRVRALGAAAFFLGGAVGRAAGALAEAVAAFFFGTVRPAAAALRAGFALFFGAAAFFGFFFAALFAADLRAAVFTFGRAAALRAGLDFFLDEAAFDVPLALRLAMMESFRNLDSVAISVVLSDAYRKSDGAAEHLLTEIAGRRTPLPERRHSYG